MAEKKLPAWKRGCENVLFSAVSFFTPPGTEGFPGRTNECPLRSVDGWYHISTSDRCRGVAWELVSALVICLECGNREKNCSVLLYSSMYRTITRTLTYAAYMLHIF